MHIALITPSHTVAQNGNTQTTQRWARMLRRAGHRVAIAQEWDGARADLMIALHARRSYASIAAFAAAFPRLPLIVLMAGTDLYRDIRSDATAQHAMQLATRLVVLQARGGDELSPALRAKTRVIFQSAPTLKPHAKRRRSFDVCVVGNLREEKDPLRAAYAVELLPGDSRIRVLHAGAALDPALRQQAEQISHPRWRWLGPRAHRDARRLIAQSRLLLQSSRMEGGANTIVEAVAAGVPVLASAVPGNIGMLGEAYCGYYPLADSEALAALMHRAETDAGFYATLAAQCAARAPLFEPAREYAALQSLIKEFDSCMPP